MRVADRISAMMDGVDIEELSLRELEDLQRELSYWRNRCTKVEVQREGELPNIGAADALMKIFGMKRPEE